MSHEYRLVFRDDLTAQRVMDSLRVSESCVRADHEFVYLKDRISMTNAIYDARLSHDESCSLWLEVNFKSQSLYDLVRETLEDKQCKCLSDGEPDEEVELYEAFQLKNLRIPRP